VSSRNPKLILPSLCGNRALCGLSRRHFSAELGVGTGSQLGTVHGPLRNASPAPLYI
jgi:hypothetical protein